MSYSVTHFGAAIFGFLKPSAVGSKTCTLHKTIFIYASKTLLLSRFKVARWRMDEVRYLLFFFLFNDSKK